MRKTNDELDAVIAEQQGKIAEDAERVDVSRGHVSKSYGRLLENRRNAIRELENQKEVITITLRAGL